MEKTTDEILDSLADTCSFRRSGGRSRGASGPGGDLGHHGPGESLLGRTVRGVCPAGPAGSPDPVPPPGRAWQAKQFRLGKLRLDHLVGRGRLQ
jgi:hypothetical protein